MHRIDGPSATPDGHFTEGSPSGGVPATTVTDDWLNDVQEEIISVLTAAGITPVKGVQNQLLSALAGALASRPEMERSLEKIGYQKYPGGLIENWGTVTLGAVTAVNSQVIAGVTYYTHFYIVSLSEPYTQEHFEVVASLAGRPFGAQEAETFAFVRTNKITSGPGESLTGFTVSVTTPLVGYVPVIHYKSSGK